MIVKQHTLLPKFTELMLSISGLQRCHRVGNPITWIKSWRFWGTSSSKGLPSRRLERVVWTSSAWPLEQPTGS